MSRKPYECFRCRDNGFPNTQVYLAGKDDSGKTVYVEEDGTTHQHKVKQSQQQEQQQGSTTVVTEPTSIKIINAKLDSLSNKMDQIISLLEQEKK